MLAALRLLGYLMHIPAVMALFSLIALGWMFTKEENTALAFTLIVSLIIGQAAYWSGKNRRKGDNQAYLWAVVFGWLMVPLLGALPFWIMGYFSPENTQGLSNFISGFFESMSGYTSCGLTVCIDSGELAPVLQWWRSLSQWVGGLGMIVFMMWVLEPRECDSEAYNAEARTKVFTDSLGRTVRIMIVLYSLFALAAMVAFYMTDMPLWQAINHGLTAVSTGGLTMNGEGMRAYSSSTQAAAVVFMIIGAVAFRAFYQLLFERDFIALLKNTELRFFCGWMIAGFIATWAFMHLVADVSTFDLLFVWASAAGTCGYATVDLADWNAAQLLPLMLAMFVGGMAGSTAGGLKIQRCVWLAKGVIGRLKAINGNEQKKFSYDGETVSHKEAMQRVRSASVLAVAWLLTLFGGILVVYIINGDKYSMEKVLFEVTSALSGVGLSSGIISSETQGANKLLFTILMWLGRLEILAVVATLFGILRMPFTNGTDKS